MMQKTKEKAIKREMEKGLLRGIETFLEILLLSLVYYLFWRYGYDDAGLFQFKGKYVLMGIYGVISFFVIKNMDGFLFGDLRRFDLALAQWIAIFITNFLTYFQLSLIENSMITPVPMILLSVVDIAISTVFVYICTHLHHLIYAPKKMIMVFGTDNSLQLKVKMDSRRDKYRVKKLISSDEDLDTIFSEIVKYDAVVINDVPAQTRNDILKFCYQHHLRAYVVPKITDVILRGSKDVSLFDTPIFFVKGIGLTITQRVCKRLLDIVLCLLAMIIAAPIMLIVAIAIKLEDGGPVFYKQKRVTINEKKFDILKFRSMIVNAEAAGISIPATGEDPRITKVGKVIRAMRIDELPQILNILKGDMSIVGPRPERVEHVEEYTKDIPEFTYRLKVKGGLTGYAQIYGKYNTNAYDKLRMDLLYIENYSLLLDLKLIATTIRIMFQKESTEGFEKAAETENAAKIIAEKEMKKNTENEK